MEYSLSIVKKFVHVDSFQDFSNVLSAIPSVFFHQRFEKSKSEYLKIISRLFSQIDHDFHFVWILKQERYAFQLRWKESVLKAHLEILIVQIPNDLQIKKVI